MTMPTTEFAKPARRVDRLRFLIQELVAEGKLRPDHTDREAMRMIADQVGAKGRPGWERPSERTMRRHLAQLRPLWRMTRK
jgi:glutamyl/glutaminyl-tRNA synthetase